MARYFNGIRIKGSRNESHQHPAPPAHDLARALRARCGARRLLGPDCRQRPSHPAPRREDRRGGRRRGRRRDRQAARSSSTRILTSRSSTATRTSSATTARPSSSRAPSRWRTSRSSDDALSDRYGVRVVRDTIVGLDADRRTVVAVGEKGRYAYDKLIVCARHRAALRRHPGLLLGAELAATKMPSGWIAGPQTQLLADQLEAMPQGGTLLPRRTARCRTAARPAPTSAPRS